MAIVVKKFTNVQELNDHLVGVIVGGVDVRRGVYDLQGKTLIFTSPSSTTVTFSKAGGTSQTLFTIQDIKGQIEAQLGAVTVKFKDGMVIIVEDTPASGVSITALGTANGILGFGNVIATSGKFYGAVIASPPAFVDLAVGPGGELYLTTVE
jgi:hypothetical protein